MILWTEEENTKLGLIDRLFSALSLDDLKELTDREEIVARLKGIQTEPKFCKLINEHITAQGEMALLRTELVMLKDDMRTVIGTMDRMHNPPPLPSHEFRSLKSKYGVY